MLSYTILSLKLSAHDTTGLHLNNYLLKDDVTCLFNHVWFETRLILFLGLYEHGAQSSTCFIICALVEMQMETSSHTWSKILCDSVVTVKEIL